MVPHVMFYLCMCTMLGLTHFIRTAYVRDKEPLQYIESGGTVSSLSWAVILKEYHVPITDSVANEVAKQVGLVNRGQIGHLQRHYLFSFDPLLSSNTNDTIFNNSTWADYDAEIFLVNHAAVKRSAEQKLRSHPLIENFHQEVFRKRVKRFMEFSDPLFPKQWHLVNTEDFMKDINVSGVWEHNITGKGVTVCVVDDGVEWKNPDLRDNYRPEGSWDLNDDDPDPSPEYKDGASNNHGTRCAGEIAAGNNAYCGIGVAYNAYFSALRALDGTVTDSLEATAFNMKMDVNDIYSCSWGPQDDGRTVDGPHYLAAKAMELGTQVGRSGYGSIYVVASGNGGSNDDNCNFDGYANSVYTVTIGAVDENGYMPYYAEQCPAMLAVTYSSGSNRQWDIVTTDWTQNKKDKGCTMHHTGTSAAAPLAAGMIALMLEARPCLSWRDVQYIIVMTALKVDVVGSAWYQNKAGLNHSNSHGFGLLSAWRLVNAAKVWMSVPWKTQYKSAWQYPKEKIPLDPQALTVNMTVSEEELKPYGLFILEYVQVRVSIAHSHRGHLLLWLKCPSGSVTILATARPKDNHTEGFDKWTFTTVRCWGEEPHGFWILGITDTGQTSPLGQLNGWQLILHGTPMTTDEFQERLKIVQESASGDFLNSTVSYSCSHPYPYVQVQPISEKILKVLVISGLFMIIIAVYETLEYMCCYQDEKVKQITELLENSGESSLTEISCDAGESSPLMAESESLDSGEESILLEIMSHKTKLEALEEDTSV